MSRARDLATFVSNADGDIKFDTDTLFIDSSENRVGIGTSSPDDELDVEGSDPAIRLTDTSASGYARLFANNGSLLLQSDEGNSVSNSIIGFDVDGTERMRIDSNGNVGVGTSSPLTGLYNTVAHVSGTSGGLILSSSTSTFGIGSVAGVLQFYDSTNASERMRIDSSGNLLVGTTLTAPAASSTETGIALSSTGYVAASVSGAASGFFNRLTSDGTIVEFRKNGTTVGSIGNSGGAMYVSAPSAGGLKYTYANGTSAIIQPCNTSGAVADNVHDLGSSGARFDDIFATNGTIQTSDRNEKQDIEDLSDAELRVATAAKGLIKKYRWIDAVQEKGDDARIHVGIIAQDLQAAFEAEGLDAGRYAMFISSTWWEADEVIPAVEAQEAVYETQTDEEGNETQVLVSEAVEAQPERTVTNTYETAEEAPEGATERTRLGVRYPELLAFIIGAM